MHQGRRAATVWGMDKTTRNVILAAASMSGFIATFAASGIVVAAEPIQREFDLSVDFVAWIPLAYIVGAAAALMPASRLADIFGRLRVFTVGIAGFAVLAIASAFAPSGSALIAIRAAQGLAASLVFATNIAIVSLSQPPETKGRALGILTAGVYLGSTTGPVLGGIIVHHLHWRALLLIVGGFGVVNLALAVWRLRGADWKAPRVAPFDLLGSALWVLSFPALLMGLTLLPGLLGTLLVVVGILGLVLLVWLETRAADPILDVGLLRRNRVYAFANLAALINYSANFAMVFLMTMYLEFNRGLPPDQAGYVVVCGVALQAVVSPFAGRLADRLNPRLIAATGMGLCTLGLLAFAFLGATTAYGYIIVALCLLGLGFALFASPIAHIVTSSVDKRDVGMASATLSAMRIAGQGFSMGIAGLALALMVGRHAIDKNDPTDLANLLSGTRISFAVFSVMCVLGVFSVLLAKKDQGR